jgi:RNA polymerase sigma-70 factor (ECF subfamily)
MTTVVVPASVEVGVKSISVGLVLGRQTMLSQMRHKIKLQQNICVALFLLHEVFDYPFSEIGSMLEKSPANCRQIFHRARQALQDKRARFEPEPQRQRQLLFSFLSASQAGDMAALTSLLAQDAVSWSDGGGKVQSNLKPIHGQQAVARFWCFWLSVARKNQRPLTFTLAEINGSPAILFWDEGSLAVVISLTLSAVGIQEIYALLNPEKLAYLQKQLSSSRIRE